MPRLTDILTVAQGETATIVGSGGKTALLWLLARHYQHNRVLVTTTRKIGLPEATRFGVFRDSDTLLEQAVRPGITLAGEAAPDKDFVKIGALAPDVLEEARRYFDHIFIEGDGSKTLPLKGWADYEPVVPAFSDCTVGILPLWPLGLAVDETIIHRLPLFCAISGASPGESLTVGHLASAITHPAGLFKDSHGRRVILLNQVEDQQAEATAAQLVDALGRDFLQGIALVVCGSVLRDEGKVLWSLA